MKKLSETERRARNAYMRDYYHRRRALELAADGLLIPESEKADPLFSDKDRYVPETAPAIAMGFAKAYSCRACARTFHSTRDDPEEMECPYCLAKAVNLKK